MQLTDLAFSPSGRFVAVALTGEAAGGARIEVVDVELNPPGVVAAIPTREQFCMYARHGLSCEFVSETMLVASMHRDSDEWQQLYVFDRAGHSLELLASAP
jgi:hypothetical protein